MRPAEEDRPLTYTVLEMLHSVLRLDQFAAYGIIGAALGCSEFRDCARIGWSRVEV
jgi:hypothetical protein